jgi:hypothetical protein
VSGAEAFPLKVVSKGKIIFGTSSSWLVLMPMNLSLFFSLPKIGFFLFKCMNYNCYLKLELNSVGNFHLSISKLQNEFNIQYDYKLPLVKM